MSRKIILKVNVSRQEFRRIKRGKQTIIVCLNNEETNKIRSKDRVIIQGRIDKFRKKVKETRVYSTLEELIRNVKKKDLGYKRKDNPDYNDLIKDYSSEDIKKYGLLVIELEEKRHIFRKILLGILVIVLLFYVYRFISNKIDEANAKKFNGIINEVSKERTDYVFIEINPSFVLTVKDNKVSDVACLNDDCVSIYNDIDVKGKNLNDSIDNLYSTSKEKGFDTSNGVKVKTSSNVSIESKDYITVEYIDTTKEKELLNEVKNNEEIKNVSNDDYYSRLWEELKKDPNYDDVYTCNMNNSKELECYIILETGINKDSDYNTDTENEFNKLQTILTNSSSKIFNTLEKFNFDIRKNKYYRVIVNGIEFNYSPLVTLDDNGKVDIYKNALTAEKIDILDNSVCDYDYAQYENGVCQVKDGIYIIPLEKVNLVNPTSAVNNIVTRSYGVTEKLLENYKFIYEADKQQKEKEERIRKCIPIIESKGVYCCNSKDGENDICGTCSSRSIDLLESNTMFCYIDANGYPRCGMMNQTFREFCD